MINFLSGDDTGFEASVGDWVATGTNTSIARSTAQAHSGAASLALTSQAAGAITAASAAAASITALGMPVVPGQPVRSAAWFRAASTGQAANAGVGFYDASGTAISTLAGPNVTDTTTGWAQAVAGVLAPANAAWARARPQVNSTAAAGEVHYADDVELNPFVYYDPSIGRVRVDLAVLRAALGADGSGGLVERSTDQIRWTTVRGGSSATVTASAVPVDDYEFAADTVNYYRVTVGGTAYPGAVTPSLGGVPWLKSVRYPFLNTTVELADATDVTYPSMGGVFPVIGRRLPVAVTAIRGSAQYSLMVRTEDTATRQSVEAILATGEIIFLQVPAVTPDGFTYPVPSGYYAVGDATSSREDMPWERRTFTLPLTEVDAPDPSVTAVTITWQGVIDAYASWTAVVAANATWAGLVQTLGTPADVITG